MLADLLHEPRDEIGRNSVHPVIVIAELRHRGLAFVAVVHGQAGLVANHADLSVLDGGKTVGDHREACNPERHGSQYVAVVQRHLEAFIEILVVHVVDTIHRMHIGAREPIHRDVELLGHLVVIEEFAGDGRRRGCDLFARDLVAAAIDRVEQRFREIDAGAEELHLLAQPHSRHAACDAVIVAPEGAHQVVVLVLQR